MTILYLILQLVFLNKKNIICQPDNTIPTNIFSSSNLLENVNSFEILTLLTPDFSNKIYLET